MKFSYDELSSGISSEYDSQKRIRNIANEIESWADSLGKEEYEFRLSVLLRSAMHRGEARVVQFLESKGAKLRFEEKDHRYFRINLRFLADIRNWFRFILFLGCWYVFETVYLGMIIYIYYVRVCVCLRDCCCDIAVR